MCEREIVLITGGAGFLGQHLIREIQENCFEIDEIRVLDLVKYENKLNNKERIEVKSFIWNIVTECDFAFENVKTVFHCAALINYEFPPVELNVNVKATQNIIESCLRNGVESLIYTSTAEVCIKPYFNNGFFCISINRTESKELPPEDERQLVFGAYAASKLKSEELILAADTEHHYSGHGVLRTTALRPPFIYGEEDNGVFQKFIEIGKNNDNCLWRIGGPGGKHQFAYAGNIAWAHIMAKKQLKEDPDRIGGLPLFTTDDTGIFDLFKFCEILTEENGKPHIKKSTWNIPTIISFLIFYIFEIFYNLLFNFGLKRLPFSPKSLVVYLGSAVLFSRLRSTLHTGYSPRYKQDESLRKSRNYYLSKFKTK